MGAGRAQRYLQPGTPRKEKGCPILHCQLPCPPPNPSGSHLGRQVLLSKEHI